jgi:excisionase family DNA binding protein
MLSLSTSRRSWCDDCRQQTASVTKRILTIREAAAYLGLTVKALSHKAQAGKIPVTLVDRTYRFDKRHLDRWIEETQSWRIGRGLCGIVNEPLERAHRSIFARNPKWMRACR